MAGCAQISLAIVAITFLSAPGAMTSADARTSASSPEKKPPSEATAGRFALEVSVFRRVESGEGLGYYRIMEDEQGGKIIRGTFEPGMETVTLAVENPEHLRASAKRLRWRWRALTFPKEGDECRPGFTDSAAAVYITFKRGLKWRVVKYVWSTVGPLGKTCEKKNTLFTAQETVILESGGSSNVWRQEEIDLRSAYREHYEGGDPGASVPDFVGVGIMTDGDQTESLSVADYAGFEIVY